MACNPRITDHLFLRRLSPTIDETHFETIRAGSAFPGDANLGFV